jgi:hypothetical protein
MQATTDLTSTQWQVADTIARQLVLDQTDLNEFRKTISYLRAYGDRPEAGKKYFDYLNALARNGDRIGHSKKTRGYLESITATCQKYLDSYKDDAATLLQILGWAARLMQYYKAAGPIGEMPEPTIQSERETEIQAVVANQEFFEGQTLEAIVRGINKNKVTYEMLGTLRLTAKEPKHAKVLSEGQSVTVEITALKPDGSPKNVKFTG